MKKYGNEFRVGLFFLICILGLVFLTYRTGKLSFSNDGYSIQVVFDDIAGLEEKAPVMLNGLEVGKVNDIKVVYEDTKTRIILTLWIDKYAKIRTNPVVSIKTLGLMGEKYIQIASTEGTEFIKPGHVLRGKAFTDMDVLMEEAKNITQGLDSLISNVDSLAGEVKTLAVNLNNTVENNQHPISQMIQNLEATSQNIEELSLDLKHNPWKLLYKPKNKKK